MIHTILGTAHLSTTPGKRSPDGLLSEACYSRLVCQQVAKMMKDYKRPVSIDLLDLQLPDTQDELKYRVNYVNRLCDLYGPMNVAYVSIHVNASGLSDQWKPARGWSIYTSRGYTGADRLATCIYNAAVEVLPPDHPNAVRKDMSDGDPDFEADFYVLRKTKCPAVLTENLFMDNQQDCDFLLSPNGFDVICRLHFNGILDYLRQYDRTD